MAKTEDTDQFTMTFSDKAEDSPWWAKDISTVLKPETSEMLQQYIGIPQEQLIEHIAKTACSLLHIRQRAWDLSPWPSIGALTWLDPYITLHQSYDLILAKANEGATILDCGCFISPDLRYLAFKGAPTKNMYGFDIVPGFFDLGFDYYNDRDRFHGRFLEADGSRDLTTSALGQLKEQVDVIWCPKYLHIYDREHQVQVACNLVQLLRPRAGSLFVGSQNGLPEPEDLILQGQTFEGQQSSAFLGNAETIREVWNEVAARTGTKWDVQARLLDLRTIGLHKDDGSMYKRKTGYNLQWTTTLVEPST